MKVKLTRDFTCHPPDKPGQKVTFPKGDEVTGQIADWAVAHGAAEAPKAAKSTKAAKAAPENKSDD